MLKFIRLSTILFLFTSCTVTKDKSENLTEKFSLKCMDSLNLNVINSEEDKLDIIKFVKKNECNNKAIDFANRAIEAVENNTIRKVSFDCLNKYFEMNNKSPFNISFGGVFSCEEFDSN